MAEPSAFGGQETILNADQLRGNVALIKRGIVPFTVKARRAAAAGAIGVIFINSDDTTFLAEGDNGPGVRIPCVLITKSDGDQLATSTSVSALLPPVCPGPRAVLRVGLGAGAEQVCGGAGDVKEPALNSAAARVAQGRQG